MTRTSLRNWSLWAVAIALGWFAIAREQTARADEPQPKAADQTPQPATERVPILLDTDLGSDIDDAFALALILANPRCELRGITTVGADAEDRAWMACRFLTHTDRKETPVAFGRGKQPDEKIDWQIQYRRHPAVVWNRTAKPVKQSAVDLLYEQLQADQGHVTIVAIGPLTNIAQLLEQHPDCKPWIKRIIFNAGASAAASSEAQAPSSPNIRADLAAAKAVLKSGVPLTVLFSAGAKELEVVASVRQKLFSACTPLTYQVQSLYELWDKPTPLLDDALVAALATNHEFCTLENSRLVLADDGKVTLARKEEPATFTAERLTSVDADRFFRWYLDRVTGFGKQALPKEPGNEAKLIEPGALPRLIHVAEDYETDIEKRWWMTGKLETADVPTGSQRACRAVLTQDYDDRQGDMRAFYRAVIFNPVPGPPMGKNSRVSFRYKLHGTSTLRVQIFSLANGYHRYLSVKNLPQDRWQSGAVDMTEARRPDGSGGPLAEDERIDDIQFYVDPRAELLIDDIVLYDAAPPEEKRPFPKGILYTGWFDTGKLGQEWPGDFEIVPHESPLKWKAAKTIANEKLGAPWIRLGLRGLRTVPATCQLRFRYRLSGADADGGQLDVTLANSKTGQRLAAYAGGLIPDRWSEANITFDAESRRAAAADAPVQADELQFVAPKGATLLLDDVLLYEPGESH